jgi:hypothetical protein
MKLCVNDVIRTVIKAAQGAKLCPETIKSIDIGLNGRGGGDSSGDIDVVRFVCEAIVNGED